MILVRHGQSVANALRAARARHLPRRGRKPVRRRWPPAPVDPPLTALGARQAEAAAELLRAEDVERIVASPLTRALETAAIVAAALDVPVAVDALVREQLVSRDSIGRRGSALRAEWPGFAFGELAETWWSPSRETPAELLARCRAFRERLAAAPDWRHVAVVTHWGVILALAGRRSAPCALLRLDLQGRSRTRFAGRFRGILPG